MQNSTKPLPARANHRESPPGGGGEPTRVAALCFRLLEYEAEALGKVQEAAQRVRAALVGGDSDALVAALEYQESVVGANEGQRRRRQEFQEEAAALLDVAPAAVTLRGLSSHLPATEARRVEQWRQRLRGLAMEADLLQRSNARLIHECLDFFHRFFLEITGGRNNPRYDPAGRCHEAVASPLFEVRG